MAESKQATFIPKTSNKRARKVRHVKRIYIIGYLSYMLFFGTILVVLGAYFYGVQVERTVEEKKTELLEKKTRFNESHVTYLQELDSRLRTAAELIDTTSAPSKLLSALEETVIDTVVLNSFQIQEKSEFNDELVATIDGKAATFDDAIYQREVIGKNTVLAGASVSDFSYGQIVEEGESAEEVIADNQVSFTYTMDINASIIPYDPNSYQASPDAFPEEGIDLFGTGVSENDNATGTAEVENDVTN